MPEMTGQTAMKSRTQGYIDVGPGRVWYEMAGEGERTLLLLHGGPGGNCEDLTEFMDLAGEGFRVVRYDQLGSWRSDQPDDVSLWNVPRFVAEVETVRRALDLGRMHLLGQSWGGMLALEYALQHQEHLRSLIIYSGPASVRECMAGMAGLRALLPAEDQDVLRRHEASGDTDDAAYVAVMERLYQENFCRVWPYPAGLAEAMQHLGMQVYETMWGPNEFTCTGTLLDWDLTDRLGEIRVPTLITNGRYDEVVPSCGETIHRRIPGSELVIFEESSHHAHLEEPERYFAVLRDFLARVEAESSPPAPTP